MLVAPYIPRALPAAIPLIVALGAAGGWASMAAQTLPPSPTMDPAPSIYETVDSLYRAGRSPEALSLIEEHLSTSPGDYRGEVLAAREALVLGIVASYDDHDQAKALLRRAADHAERATTLDPEGEDGRYYKLAAIGRLALVEGARERARLAVVVDSAARSLLATDSLHAGAHDALGHLYMEVASLSWVERIFARHWVGGELMSRATWEAAERELRRAIELQPERNLYYVDLGELYVKRKRWDDALAVLEEGVKVPLEIPAQSLFRDDASRLLEEVRKHTG